MFQRIAVVSVLLFLTLIACAEKKKIQQDPIMLDVTARGQALFAYDQAAWHATDAVRATNPPKESVGRYIAYKSDEGWKVAFGHLNQSRDKFLVAYEATQGATLQEFTAKKSEPAREYTAFCLSAARAVDTALDDFRGEKRPYNVAVLPAEQNRLYVYVVPAQTKDGVYPLGGDVRYLIQPDGSAIIEKRQLHKSILEDSSASVPKGAKPTAGYHTHILSDVPEDTDVFHVLTRQPPLPEVVITGGKKMYEISTDGTIQLGKM